MDDDWSMERVPRDDDSTGVRLSDTRLYVCNIPEDINDKGLERAFSKFGTIVGSYVSRDSSKRFALITFDNSQEANQAILGLNRKPPLNLTIRFANDSKSRKSTQPSRSEARDRYRSDAVQTSAAPRDCMPLSKPVSDYDDMPTLKTSTRAPSSSSGSRTGRLERSLQAETYPLEQEAYPYEEELEDYGYDYGMYEDEDMMCDLDEADMDAYDVQSQILYIKLKELELQKAKQQFLRRSLQQPVFTRDRFVTADLKRIVVRTDAGTSTSQLPIEYKEVIAGERRGHSLEVTYSKPYSLDAKEIPPLVEKKACVLCHKQTSTYCSSCNVTPYCSQTCQHGDWPRHRAVCHNLALNPNASAPIIHGKIQLAKDDIAQKPKTLNRGAPACYKKPEFKIADNEALPSSSRSQKHDNINYFDRSPKGNARDNIDGKDNFDNNAKGNTRGNFDRTRNDNFDSKIKDSDRPGGGRRDFNGPRNDRKDFDRPRNDWNNEDRSNRRPFNGNGGKNIIFDRPRNDRPRHDRNDFDGNGDRSKTSQGNTKMRSPLKNEQAKRNEDDSQAARSTATSGPAKVHDNRPLEKTTVSPQPIGNKPVAPAQAKIEMKSMTESAPKEMQEKEVPLRYTGELICVGNVVMISVESVSEGKLVGYLFAEAQADDYNMVCDVLAGECEADQQEYKASPGEVFCVHDPADDGWYRARCLSDRDGGIAALMDAGRVLPVQGKQCRKIPEKFLEVQEFSYEGTTDASLTVGENYACTIKSKSGGVITLTVDKESQFLGEATIRRWRPPVEKPEPKTPSPVAPTESTAQKSEPAAQKPEPAPGKPEPAPEKPEPSPQKPDPKILNAEPVAQNTEPTPQTLLSFKQRLFQKYTQTATAVKDVPETFEANEVAMNEPFCVSIEAMEGGRYICLTIAEQHMNLYQTLMDNFAAVCEQDSVQIVPQPGELFSVRNPVDGSWYRARCLCASEGGLAALMDSGKLLPLTDVPCRTIAKEFADIPEFCCVLETASKLEVGSNFLCEAKSSSEGIVSVLLSTPDDPAVTFEGKMSRWRPPVIGAPTASTKELNTPTGAMNTSTGTLNTSAGALNTSTGSQQPSPLELYGTVVEEWSHPELVAGAVVITDVGSAQRVSVRSADANIKRKYDATLVDACTHGQSASPLKVPLPVGAVVVADYEDGVFYRAAVRKTKQAANKYWLEYIDFGNEGPSQLEKMRACPPELAPSARPVLVSKLKLQGVTCALSEEALTYLDTLKDEETPLLLSLPSVEHSMPSGSEAVLTVGATKQQINSKVQDMSLPVWEKLFKDGKSVTELPVLGLDDVKYASLPETGGELRVLNTNLLRSEQCTVTVCPVSEPALTYVNNVLPKQLEAYCSSQLGADAYLPRPYELCIAKFPGRDTWCRAVVVEQMGGPGGRELSMLCLDHSEMGTVPVAHVRKMLAEFIKQPAVGLLVYIQGLAIVNDSMEERARSILESGTLAVQNCKNTEKGEYTAEAPAFIAALADVD